MKKIVLFAAIAAATGLASSLTQQRRVKEEGFRVVNFFCRGRAKDLPKCILLAKCIPFKIYSSIFISYTAPKNGSTPCGCYHFYFS